MLFPPPRAVGPIVGHRRHLHGLSTFPFAGAQAVRVHMVGHGTGHPAS